MPQFTTRVELCRATNTDKTRELQILLHLSVTTFVLSVLSLGGASIESRGWALAAHVSACLGCFVSMLG